MAHTKRPRNPDHVRRVNVPGPQDATLQKHFEELLSPAVYAQSAFYRSLDLRDRILNLPLMIAAILAMLWRQIPSVCELTKTLNREGALWMRPAKVSQPALSKRLLAFPAELFQQVLHSLLPKLRERWRARQRPLPESVSCALHQFGHLYAVDGSALEALFRKLDALQDTPSGALAGKICTVIDLATRLPEQIWYTAEALAHDTNFISKILSLVHTGTLWIFDRGFYDFTFFDALIDRGGHFITRLKSNAVLSVQGILVHSAEVRDRLILLGRENGACQHTLRLIEVRFGATWYSYLTSVLDPAILPANVVADLYRRRWRIEEAFLIVKRLLNLAYLWTGSLNGVLLQVWATWLFFALLVDLGDAVAEELMLPFDRISLEMVFRGLYHFTQAHHRGEATDPIKYLSAPENQDLGVIKRLRKKQMPALTLSTA
jgi:IS4 transposase